MSFDVLDFVTFFLLSLFSARDCDSWCSKRLVQQHFFSRKQRNQSIFGDSVNSTRNIVLLGAIFLRSAPNLH